MRTRPGAPSFLAPGEPLHLNVDVAHWAAGPLTVFVVGPELKREFVAGDLHKPQRAVLPITAAVCAVIAPALVFTAINASTGGDALRSLAVPTPPASRSRWQYCGHLLASGQTIGFTHTASILLKIMGWILSIAVGASITRILIRK